MLLSVVIPARNEAECLGSTITTLIATLNEENIPHEILVVDDGSTEKTVDWVRDHQQLVGASLFASAS